VVSVEVFSKSCDTTTLPLLPFLYHHHHLLVVVELANSKNTSSGSGSFIKTRCRKTSCSDYCIRSRCSHSQSYGSSCMW